MGVLVQKFLRYKVDGSNGYTIIAVVNTKLIINKKLDRESWHCSISQGSTIINM